MNKLIKNQELFQGKKYLNKNKEYFEGWYFKNTSNTDSISFIPGISINKEEKISFIQVITNNKSYYIKYDIDDFYYSENPFYIKIKNNYFSTKEIYIDIKDIKQKINIQGKLEYTNSVNIKTSKSSPNIMGPFSYIPYMECNHAIISMKNYINGKIRINNDKIIFNNGIGYIEKDWGTSFPKEYLWCQGNNFEDKKVSFMFSIADIPVKIFSFRGFISVLIIDDKEYRFTTYNKSKIIKYDVNEDIINIKLKKGKYILLVESNKKEGLKLKAPVKGKMNKIVYESIDATIKITLKNKEKVIFTGISNQCGLEIVK